MTELTVPTKPIAPALSNPRWVQTPGGMTWAQAAQLSGGDWIQFHLGEPLRVTQGVGWAHKHNDGLPLSLVETDLYNKPAVGVDVSQGRSEDWGHFNSHHLHGTPFTAWLQNIVAYWHNQWADLEIGPDDGH